MAVTELTAGFAVAVVREEGRWRCSALDAKVLTSLKEATAALAKLRSTGALFGLFAVDDEFFVIVRPSPRGTTLLLSDSAAALDYDFAADVLDQLGTDPPDEVDDEIWPEGDLDVLADLGLPGVEMQVIIDDADLYPDEQLQMIAQRCGFADQFAAVLDEI